MKRTAVAAVASEKPSEAKQPPASEAKSRRHGVAGGYTLKFKANG
jgi:hypothetical protein